MGVKVTLQECPNKQVVQFSTDLSLTKHIYTTFFTAHNLCYSQRELRKIGMVAQEIVCQVLDFYEVRTVFVSASKLTVVLKTNKEWNTLPDQIARIIEKAFDEFGVCQ